MLAVQGAFAEHIAMLKQLGVDAVAVRLPQDLDGVSGLIIPGGESTAMRKLIDRWGLRQPILDLARKGAPIFGTCAGMILLSQRDHRRRRARLSAARHLRQAQRLRPAARKLRVGAHRARPGRSAGPRGVHPRARSSSASAPDVDVLAELDDGRVVAVRKGNVIATAFHPELAGETRFHRSIATMAAEYAEPGEGSGRRPPSGPASQRVIAVPGRARNGPGEFARRG